VKLSRWRLPVYLVWLASFLAWPVGLLVATWDRSIGRPIIVVGSIVLIGGYGLFFYLARRDRLRGSRVSGG
jgi:hypothetical protein